MASIAPVFAPDVQDIMRRRQMADALLKQGMSTPSETQFAGGAAVKNSPILGFANLLAAGLGAYKKKTADSDYAKAMANALKGIQGTEEPTTAPQVSNVPQGTSAQPAYDPYSDPMNPTGAPAPQMPSQPAPQVSNTPQQGMTQSTSQAMPQGQVNIEQIMRMQQFPELKPYADLLLKQMQDKHLQDYKFQQEQQGAEAAFKRQREGHQQDRTFDIQNPEVQKPPASVAEYNFAKENGYKGTFDQYQREQRTPIQAPDRELVQVVGPDGQPVLVPRSQAVGARPYHAPQQQLDANGQPIIKQQPIPSEIQARIALGENYAKQVPDILAAIDQGKVTSMATLFNYGDSGLIAQRQESGVDALIRNLTGAGKSKEEAQSYAKRYAFEPTDSNGRMKQKVLQLSQELKAIDDAVKTGRGWPASDAYSGIEAPKPIAAPSAITPYSDPQKEAAYQAWKARQK